MLQHPPRHKELRFKVSPEEERLITEAAIREERTVSNFVRYAALRHARLRSAALEPVGPREFKEVNAE